MDDLLDGGLHVNRLRRIPEDGTVTEPLDVRVVGPDERDSSTGQTPRLQRFEAVSDG